MRHETPTTTQALIQTLSLGELETNCYLVTCPQTHETLIVDPADSAQTILDTCLQQSLQPLGIVLTHGHFDHVLALLELKLTLDIPTWLHPGDTHLLKQARTSAQHWLRHDVDPVPTADHELFEGLLLPFGHHSLTILETPGHTPGSICLLGENYILTGDTLFAQGVGRTDFSYSSPLKLNNSLHRLKQLPPDLTIYPGHGPHTQLSQALAQLS